MMDAKKIDDGGPAFPRIERHADGAQTVYFGLSARDWFAGQAIGAIIRQCASDLQFRDGSETSEQYFARKAYEVADAMLAARKGGAS